MVIKHNLKENILLKSFFLQGLKKGKQVRERDRDWGTNKQYEK